MALPEIHVAPDRFEVCVADALLVTQLDSALAVCLFDAVEPAGAMLHLRCIVRSNRPADVTDSTLATELLLLERCLESLRAAAPAARALQGRIVVHLAGEQARTASDSVVGVARGFLEHEGVQLPPADVAGGSPRQLRFRPGMGWVNIRS